MSRIVTARQVETMTAHGVNNNNGKENLTKEDALADILELLDSNSQWYLCDLTKEEYNELKSYT